MRSSDQPCYAGFSWHVPHAFRDAVAYCNFTEGDLLYSRGACPVLGDEAFLQVLWPERERAPRDANISAVFERNWFSRCGVELYPYGAASRIPGVIETTQGLLYMTLWRGNSAWLTYDGEHPSPPPGVKAIKKALAAESVRTSLESILRPVGTAFVMPSDLSNDLYREKRQKVEAALGPEISAEPSFLRTADLPIRAANSAAPTSGLLVFDTPRLSSDDLFDLVKKALYQPSPTAKRSQFRITAHGHILP